MPKKIYFLLGVCISVIVLPFLQAIGVPSFEVVLTSLFGKGSIGAVLFTAAILVLILAGMLTLNKSTN
ncbi:hypothetical protein [Salibacterium halotolerans]|uniref:Uncharacterized protein n=1 Tax=Salibacterium halotolerans TaxID=1884432 RepID=A0A1I5RT23_9BACI|nr:hypothetical protein [Salibacterium halotolerans]SFP61557.1 hypothetical protein SAMN05518683_107157 [Salibacterium halotolerans]